MNQQVISPSAKRAFIDHDGENWEILSQGARRDGKVFCHLASTTVWRVQRNGRYPKQMCDWIPEDLVDAAVQP